MINLVVELLFKIIHNLDTSNSMKLISINKNIREQLNDCSWHNLITDKFLQEKAIKSVVCQLFSFPLVPAFRLPRDRNIGFA